MEPERARFAALRLFGNPTLLREEARRFWGWELVGGFWRDLRYGARTLLRTPGFSLTAILVMALGIGATTSLFTIVRSVLLRPLPFPGSGQIGDAYDGFASIQTLISLYFLPTSAIGGRNPRLRRHGRVALVGGSHSTMQGEMPEVVAGAGGTWNLFRCLVYSRYLAVHLFLMKIGLEAMMWSCFPGAVPEPVQRGQKYCREASTD